MNPKIDRLSRDIEKTRDKISELQARLRDMEKQKNEMENSEIVAMFRSINVAPQELISFIKLYREQGGSAMPEVSGSPQPGFTDTQEQEDDDIEE